MSKGLPISLRRINGHVLTTKDGRRIAYYVVAPVRFSYRPESECDSMLYGMAARYAQLVGRRVHIRVTNRPYPVERWARTLDENSPNALPGWGAFLRDEQRHVLGLTLAEKVAFMGVELTKRSGRFALPFGKREDQAAEVGEMDRIVSGPGMDARPATPEEIEWLLHRSVCLGMPAALTMPPALREWEPEDIPEVTDSVSWTCEPYGRSVRVSGDIEGTRNVRHVVVLSLGRMGEVSIPGGSDPFMQLTDRLPFPVEWSAIVDILPASRVQRDTDDASKRIRSQVAHHLEDHGIEPPISLDRQNALARRIEDEVAGDFSGMATRTECHFRIAVSGETEEEALRRASIVADLYAPTFTLVRGADQFATAREFIPGEPLANNSYRRRLPVLTLAGAVPSATALVGDREGIYLGYTVGSSQRATFWEPWRRTEIGEGSGLTLIAGGLGAGKSTLTGLVAYKSVRRGIPFTVLDPSGRLGALCDLPELRDHSLSVDLMNAEPGTLNPYRVIADPRPGDYESAEEYERQRALSAAQRRTLAGDILSMLLPAQIDAMPETRIVLTKAIRHVGGEHSRSPREVIAALRDREVMGSHAEHAANIAEMLDEVGETPQAQLFFPNGQGTGRAYTGANAPLLVVFSLRGIVLPADGMPRAEWSQEERLSVPLLHLASFITARSVYERSPNERKGVAFDETHMLSATSSGRALISRVSRDSRKWNLIALMASQNVADVTTAGIGNFLGATFIGRTEDAQAQADALAALRIPQGVGYEGVLSGLSPHARGSETRSGSREFIFSDGDGGIEKVRIDLAGTPSLAAVLDTTADPSKARRLQAVRGEVA